MILTLFIHYSFSGYDKIMKSGDILIIGIIFVGRTEIWEDKQEDSLVIKCKYTGHPSLKLKQALTHGINLLYFWARLQHEKEIFCILISK